MAGITYYVNPDTGLAGLEPPQNLYPSSQGIVMTAQQRSALMDQIKSMRGSLGSATFFANPDGLSDDQLWDAYVSASQAAGNGPSEWSKIAPMLAGGLVGAGAGTVFGSASSVGSGYSMAGGEVAAGAGEGLGIGSSAAAGGTSAGAGGTVANGGTMDWDPWNWEASDTFSTDPSYSDLGGPDYTNNPEVLDMFGSTPNTPGWTNEPGAWDPSMNTTMNLNPSLLSQLLNYGRTLFGNGGRTAIPGANGAGGGLDAGKLLALAPVIAAIAHARSQGPFDTSRLESLYSRFDPNAIAYDYDVNTGRGRTALTSSLTDRGVMGSSFGNMDITNFNTNREVGRNALTNQGVGVAGGIANNILESQVKQRGLQNDLYGRALLALGNIFGGRPNYAT